MHASSVLLSVQPLLPTDRLRAPKLHNCRASYLYTVLTGTKEPQALGPVVADFLFMNILRRSGPAATWGRRNLGQRRLLGLAHGNIAETQEAAFRSSFRSLLSHLSKVINSDRNPPKLSSDTHLVWDENSMFPSTPVRRRCFRHVATLRTCARRSSNCGTLRRVCISR